MLSMQVRDPVAADGAAVLRQRMLQAQALGRADLAAQVTQCTPAQPYCGSCDTLVTRMIMFCTLQCAMLSE